MFSCLPARETAPDLHIECADPVKIYKPGETITCAVVLTNRNKFIDFKNIKIRMHGKAKTCWSQGRHSNSETESYLEEEVFLLGNDIHTITQPSGIFRYPFSYTLPLGIPSSCYEQDLGSISYQVKAIMTRSLCASNPEAKKYFLVDGSLTNLPYEMSFPVQLEKVKRVTNFLRCGIDEIFFLLEINRSGIVPGDSINFQLTIENNSRLELRQNLKLIQIMKFYANGLSKREDTEILEMKGHRIPRGESQAWNGSLQIPRNALLTGFERSNLINVRHMLKAEIKAPFLCGNVSSTLEIPLTIGSSSGKYVRGSAYE